MDNVGKPHIIISTVWKRGGMVIIRLWGFQAFNYQVIYCMG